MENTTNVLILILPALIIGLAIFFAFIYYLRFRMRMIEIENRRETGKTTLNLRLQAYERIMLFLERLSPPQLISRMQPGQLTAAQYHQLLLQTIRQEFEHNITQQLYVSDSLWTMVRNARESTAGTINSVARELPAKASAMDLATAILEKNAVPGSDAVSRASAMLKKEIAKLL